MSVMTRSWGSASAHALAAYSRESDVASGEPASSGAACSRPSPRGDSPSDPCEFDEGRSLEAAAAWRGRRARMSHCCHGHEERRCHRDLRFAFGRERRRAAQPGGIVRPRLAFTAGALRGVPHFPRVAYTHEDVGRPAPGRRRGRRLTPLAGLAASTLRLPNRRWSRPVARPWTTSMCAIHGPGSSLPESRSRTSPQPHERCLHIRHLTLIKRMSSGADT